MNISMRNGTITIDGKTFSGKSVRIDGNKVVVDGVVQEGDLVGDISVVVNGDCETVETSNANVTVKGTVGSVRTTNGEVACGSVGGDVGSTNGNITCGQVAGGVKTINGNIRHQRQYPP